MDKREETISRRDISGENNPMYQKGYLISGTRNGMYGKKHSEATIEKMKKPKSDSTKKLMSESRKGKIWINNGVEQKCIHPDDLQNYIGYEKGRLRNLKEK